MMVQTPFGGRPSVGLVDGDVFSARVLMRSLAAGGAAEVHHYADAASAIVAIAGRTTPHDVMVVNAATGADDAAHTVALLSTLLRDELLLALAPTLDRDWRERLLAAGAAAVFESTRDGNRLSREIDAMFEFWRRSSGVTGMALGA